MSPSSHPSLLLRLARLGIVGLVCLSLGMHWALLQGVAWTGMLISFAREGAMIEAVEKTFDGQHGCPLCAKVKEGQDSKKQPQQAGQSLKKLDAVLVNFTPLIAPTAETLSFVNHHALMVRRHETPETPPPRREQA